MAITGDTSYSVRPDRVTTTELNALIPEDGRLIWDTTEKLLKHYNGASWTAGSELATIITVTQANKDTTLGGTIDSDKAYLVDGIIDMGSTSIEVPTGGINILGLTVGVSKLISSENNYTMFTSPVGGSGGVIKVDMIISVTGTTSQVYDLEDVDGTNIIRLSTTDYIDCTSVGELTGYFTGL